MQARTKTTRSRGLALALIAGVLGPAAVAGEASRPPTAAAAALPPPVEAPATVPIESFAAAVAAWVAQATSTPLPAELPRIAFGSRPAMRALRAGGEAPAEAPASLDVVALYDDARRTVHLPAGWTGATPAEMSVLVHEMVHHVQNLDGRTFACPAEREAEAYAVQERWLAQFGTSLADAFSLNRIALFVLTRCGI